MVKRHLTRDGIILTFALGWATFEIVEGGGRAAVLTFLTGILLSPVVLRLDEARRARNGGSR